MKAKQKYPKDFETEIKRRSGLSVQHVISNKLQITQYKSLLPQVSTHQDIWETKRGTARY